MIYVLKMPQYKCVIFSLSFDLMLAADGGQFIPICTGMIHHEAH